MEEAKDDLRKMEAGEDDDELDEYDIALAKREIAALEKREQSWLPEPLSRVQFLRETLKEEGWGDETILAMKRAAKDLEEGAV